MKRSNLNLLLIALAFSPFAWSQGNSYRSATVVGHMCVTLVSPAALTNTQDLQFNNVALRSASSLSTNEEVLANAGTEQNRLASVRVSGNNAAYSVTVANREYGFVRNGRSVSVENFTVSGETDPTAGTIYIGATMRVRKAAAAKAATSTTEGPLAVTVNYN